MPRDVCIWLASYLILYGGFTPVAPFTRSYNNIRVDIYFYMRNLSEYTNEINLLKVLTVWKKLSGEIGRANEWKRLRMTFRLIRSAPDIRTI